LKDRLLYFPYIRVPESTWLTQTLLYWDQVSSIVPTEFTQHPDLLGPYMQKLVQEELVVQVIPGVHVYEIPNFEAAFHKYINDLGPGLAHRRADFSCDSVSMIHIEKMGQIGRGLVELGLAREAERPWYAVEEQTANDFMLYLAAALGQLASVDSSPITDDPTGLEHFANAGVAESNAGVAEYRTDQQLRPLRVQVLDRILPVPDHPMDPRTIRTFRDRHREMLVGFRHQVEQRLIDAWALPDENMRQYRLNMFIQDAEKEIQEIEAWMRDAGWRIVRGTFAVLAATLAVLAAIPHAPGQFSLAAAVLAALSRKQDHPPSLDFAYAAYAREELRLPGHMFGPAGRLLPAYRFR
jgi:hypothetical protein